MSQFNIEISPTSNPQIIKFVANSFLTESSSHEFKNVEETATSPLAKELFYLPFVKTVYISQNFIAIEKYDIVDWVDVQDEVAVSIEEYLNSGRSVIVERREEQQMPASVYAESTPNPGVMKFVATKKLTDKAYEFKDSYEAVHSPFAKALFNLPFVKEVFIHNNYVSITKFEVIDWADITMELREFIRQYLQDGKPIINDSNNINGSGDSFSALKHVEKSLSAKEVEIKKILQEYVEPAVANDGGQIELDSFNEKTGVVTVVLKGACSGCPSSTLTLKSGIQTLLQQMMPGEINSVEALNA